MNTNGTESRPAGPPSGTLVPPVWLLRVGGVDVFIHWYWLAGATVITWLLATRYLAAQYATWTDGQRWSIALLTSLLLLVPVLMHDLAHALVGRRLGCPVHAITLTVLGGRSALGTPLQTARDELRLALAGPLTTFGIAGCFAAIWMAARIWGVEPVRAVTAYLAYFSAALGLLNLLPIFPLDGARVLRSLFRGGGRTASDATRIVEFIGQMAVVLVYAAGLTAILRGHTGAGIWLIIVGCLLSTTGHRSAVQERFRLRLEGITAGMLAKRDIPHVLPTDRIRRVVEDVMRPASQPACFVVSHGGEILGLISFASIHGIEAAQRDDISAYRAMIPLDQLVTVSPATTAADVIQFMTTRNLQVVRVVDGRQFLGLFTVWTLLRMMDRDERHGAGRQSGTTARSSGS